MTSSDYSWCPLIDHFLYHPATNGLAERAVQTVKRGVKKTKSGTLSDKIARFLFAYRNTPHSTTGVSPAELSMGRKLRSPLDLLKPDLHFRVEGRQKKQKQYHDKSSRQRSFAIGTGTRQEFFSQFSRPMVTRTSDCGYRPKSLPSQYFRWTYRQTSCRSRPPDYFAPLVSHYLTI